MKDELIEEIRLRRKNIFIKDCHSKPEKFYKLIEENESKEDPSKMVDTIIVNKAK